MKLLVLSHACVTPVNQQFFAEIEEQTGWEITIIVPKKWKNDYNNVIFPKRWKTFRGKIIELPVLISGSVPLHFYFATFLSILRDLQPDFIYVHHEPYAAATAQLYLANFISGQKPISFFTWQNILKHYPFPFNYSEKFVLENSAIAFSGSYSAAEVLLQKGFKGKSILLPASVDPLIYQPQIESNTSLKTELQASASEVLIGYMGRIVEEKGLKTLLYALKTIINLSWRLIVVGSGNYMSTFDAIAQECKISDRITHLGFIPHQNAPQYLSAFDILVLPSETRKNWKEQFGRVTIEAIACGTPVIGSDSGEIPNLINKTGGGLTFPETQADVLANRITQLIEDIDLRHELAAKGRSVVLNEYSNQVIGQRFVQGINECTGAI
ncbi:glycosyltransferase family 4 protein [Pseudanabaena sp. UWO311]|uniref:glycosyltransferase family 4 protein n=1 Tax=Pseudanabaena sp. UWO311 TaxID=2487337 RepID=UPI0011582E6F|nr:glycosyltransferase family 4 protein [Pseudanabaena sp. UWO311]TYQ26950.1 glycosyltransferase family 4 protein [Pseudanabaena sp. UWO311]